MQESEAFRLTGLVINKDFPIYDTGETRKHSLFE